MTNEQLEAVRAEKWRQKANPILTQEDAEAWIAATGISLFLPRQIQLRAPAPSFAEAVLGETNSTPAPATIESAFALVQRLFAAEAAVPLNLLGTLSEQPDFLASAEALPYIFALRGDRDWKRGPRDKAAPLIVETWKTLQREGVLTAAELRSILGREVTEAAVLRALSTLWTEMRILPVYVENESTSWELIESRHQKAMQTGSGMAQAMALSALISLYLDSVIAATSDEIEAFLSPLAPRSRIREAVRGLEATRQLSTQQLGAQPVYYITGALPEFPEIAPSEDESGQEQPASFSSERSGDRKPFVRRDRAGDTAENTGERPRRSYGDRPSFGKRPAAGGPRREFKPREEGEFRPRRAEGSEGGFKKPFQKREGGDGPQRSYGDRPSFGKRPAAGGPRREFKPRGEGEFRPRRTEGSEGGFKKPFQKREGGDRPQRSYGDRPSFGKRPAAGGPRREFKPRGEGEFRPRRTEGSEGGFKKPFQKRGGGEGGFKRPFQKREDRPQGGDSRPRREFKPRSAEGRAGAGERPRRGPGDYAPRPKPSGERRPSRTGSGRPAKPFAKSGGKFGAKTSKFGAKKPSFGPKSGPRPGGKPAFGKRKKKSEE